MEGTNTLGKENNSSSDKLEAFCKQVQAKGIQIKKMPNCITVDIPKMPKMYFGNPVSAMNEAMSYMADPITYFKKQDMKFSNFLQGLKKLEGENGQNN